MSAARPGALATMLPSMKNVARMPRSASTRANSGVDSGSGPSSKVSATWAGSPWPASRRKASMRSGPMPVTPGPAYATASPAAQAAPSQAAERRESEREEGDRQAAAPQSASRALHGRARLTRSRSRWKVHPKSLLAESSDGLVCCNARRCDTRR